MDADTHEQFRALRNEVQVLRSDVREDIRGLHDKLDEHVRAVNDRCARRGEEIAVLMNHERERDRRVDRRVTIGLLLIAAVSLLLKVLP